MALIRGHHDFDDHFTQIPNDWIRDDRLTLEARGLLAQIMSHKPGWNMSIKSIAARNNVGRDKVRRILTELLTFGYLERSDKQAHDDLGHLAGFDYTTRNPEGVTQEPCKAKPYKAEPTKANRPPKNTIPIEEQSIKKNIGVEATTRPHRLPQEWKPSERLLEMFATKWPSLDRDYEVDQFVNYWLATGKPKADWDRAFQVWMAKNEKEAQTRRRPGARRLSNAERAALLVADMEARIEQAPEVFEIEPEKVSFEWLGKEIQGE